MKTDKGLFQAMRESEIHEETPFTVDKFKKFIEQLEFVPPKTPQMMLGLDFVKGVREQHGDDGLYNFIKEVDILCGGDTYDYLNDFIKKYEKK